MYPHRHLLALRARPGSIRYPPSLCNDMPNAHQSISTYHRTNISTSLLTLLFAFEFGSAGRFGVPLPSPSRTLFRIPLLSTHITAATTPATKRKKQSQNQRQTKRRRCCLRRCLPSQESLWLISVVSERKWVTVLLPVFQFGSRGVPTFFVEVDGGGEALPEGWVSDVCHDYFSAVYTLRV